MTSGEPATFHCHARACVNRIRLEPDGSDCNEFYLTKEKDKKLACQLEQPGRALAISRHGRAANFADRAQSDCRAASWAFPGRAATNIRSVAFNQSALKTLSIRPASSALRISMPTSRR